MVKGLSLAVAGTALVAGLLVFTALGVGGGDDHPSTLQRPVKVAAHLTRHQTAIQRYSEQISIRESGSLRLNEEPPIAPARFKRPIHAYLVYAAGQARRLNRDVARLRAAIGSGDREAARDAWRTAFGRYLRLGAVYGAFGELDGAIDGRDAGLHRIEHGLWGDVPVRSLAAPAAKLAHDVRRLRTAIPRSEVLPLDYATRAHEILEDAQRDFLSGVDVPWSHEGVLATASGVTATREVINTLRPLLGGQDSLDPVLYGLSRMSHTLDAIRRAHHGRLPALNQISDRERERLDGSLSWALERLQRIPGSLETTDPQPIPRLRG